ncbi:MAG: hybrid sensor histidine kinase/response regulator [Deltaproteobacteria bacterium]|nr:MAG: hybrid sensor histidine kinase/response regulator [Deltaproteobacteria bacterium]
MSYLAIAQALRLAFVGMLAFIAAYQLWVARVQNGEPVARTSAAWATALAVALLGRFIQHAATSPDAIELGYRIAHTGLFAIAPLALLLVFQLRDAARPRWLPLALVASAVPVVGVWCGDLLVSSRQRLFETLTGDAVIGPEPVPLGVLAIPYAAVVTVTVVSAFRRARRRADWFHRVPIWVVVAVVVPAIVNDSLFWAGALRTIELTDYALMFQMLTMSAAIIARSGDLYRQLEVQVVERTRDLRERERELSASLERLDRLIVTIPDVVCVLRDGVIEFANRAAESFFQTPLRELVGRRALEWVAAEDERTARTVLVDGAASPAPVSVQFRRARGDRRIGEVVAMDFDTGDGAARLAIIRDVTERHQLLAQIQVTDRLASVGTLAAGVAHEINNPLAFVSANLEVGSELVDGPLDDAAVAELRELLAECRDGVARIAAIVRDLKGFARDQGSLGPVDVASVLDRTIKMAMLQVRHRAQLVRRIRPVPAVFAERGRLGQVFLNLLVNAAQALPDDGGDHRIEVDVRAGADGRVVVDIADTGCGIPDAVRSRVFDPFVTTKPQGEGTGLGLWVSHQIVTSFGGTLELLDRAGGGTVARVTLVRADGRAPSTGEFTPRPEPAAGARYRLLVVDDERLVLASMRRLLRAYDVVTAESVDEAVAWLDRDRFDAILADLMMPGRDGVDLYEEARSRGLSDRVIILTGGACTDRAARFLDESGVPRVTKPATLPQIDRAVARVAAPPRCAP